MKGLFCRLLTDPDVTEEQMNQLYEKILDDYDPYYRMIASKIKDPQRNAQTQCDVPRDCVIAAIDSKKFNV